MANLGLIETIRCIIRSNTCVYILVRHTEINGIENLKNLVFQIIDNNKILKVILNKLRRPLASSE